MADTAPPPVPKWRQRIQRMLYTLLIVYVALVVAVAVFQRRLIYLPTKLSPAVAEQAAKEEGFSPWRNKSGQIIGWKMPAAGAATGSVLIVHGNAGCALNRDYLASPIHQAAALDVHVLEYPGYGAREGSPSMHSLLAAAEEALESLDQALPVYVVSESIGTGVAAHLAKTYPTRVAGLAMFAPYDDLAAVAQSKMPFLPVRLMLRDRFHPADWLKSYHGPVKIILAGADEIIPSKFGQRLFDEYNDLKEIQIISGARHNDIASQSPEWWKQVLAFWQQNRRQGN